MKEGKKSTKEGGVVDKITNLFGNIMGNPTPKKEKAKIVTADTSNNKDDDSSEGEAPTSSRRAKNTPSIREKLVNVHGHILMQAESESSSKPSPPPQDQLQQQKKNYRLRNIFAAPPEVAHDFVAPKHSKTDSEIDLIRSAISTNFVFDNLTTEETGILVGAFEKHNAVAGTRIITQGDVGDYFYIIESGCITFTVSGEEVGQSSKAGDSFGEIALLYDTPRAATAVADTDCVLWRVEQKVFKNIVSGQAMAREREIRSVLKTIPFLESLDDRYLHKIASACSIIKFEENEVIVKKGDEGNVFYIVKNGKCLVSDIGSEESKYDDHELERGGYFGERALLTGEGRAANVTAVGANGCECLCLSREVFERVLGPMQDLIDRDVDMKKMMSIPMLSDQCDKCQFEQLSSRLKKVSVKAKTILWSKGIKIERALFLVKKGKITLTDAKDKQTHTISPGSYFGEETLAYPADTPATKVPAEYTATVVEDCIIMVLRYSTMCKVAGRVIHFGASAQQQSSNQAKPSPVAKDLKLKDLKKHRILGAGTFGRVWLTTIKNDTSSGVYALKIQRKRDLLRHHQVDGVIREKNIMTKLDHPFIIRLVRHFQDDLHLYMLVELAQGGELFSIMHSDKKDFIPEGHARFYGACIFEGLTYMHDRNILYRDLKPENVMIGKDGFTVIIDLGFAKTVTDKTYTLCGTPLYLAPEVILGRGHDKGADHWSLGVIIYEMILGTTPFYKDDIDQITLFKKICRGKYSFPRPHHTLKITPEAKDLCSQLMVVKPTERLGSLAHGSDDIREHPFFNSVDWGALVEKKIAAPWLPKIKNATDSSNFDNWDHLEKEDKGRKDRITPQEQKKFSKF